MYTLSNLPAHGVVSAFVTCERVTPESAESGDAAERGWVREVGSREIYESRNDVPPAVFLDVYDLAYADDRADYRAEIRAVVESLGTYWHDGRGTYYSEGEEVDWQSADIFTYAVHVHVKRFGPRGWVESPVDVMARVSLVKDDNALWRQAANSARVAARRAADRRLARLRAARGGTPDL